MIIIDCSLKNYTMLLYEIAPVPSWIFQPFQFYQQLSQELGQVYLTIKLLKAMSQLLLANRLDADLLTIPQILGGCRSGLLQIAKDKGGMSLFLNILIKFKVTNPHGNN